VIFFAAEVEVDEGTGQYALTKLATVSDIGKAINPGNVEGQEEGGALMSVGQVMMERLILDERGRLLNQGALDYRVPTTRDIPLELHSLLLENADGAGPFGAKGVGESGAIAVAPAVASALTEATGVVFTDLPVTAERLWEGLQKLSVQRPDEHPPSG
jgi:CO/xanthine dehydrogenase Mo-binding subunit